MNPIKNFDDFYNIKVQPNIELFKKEHQDNAAWKIAMYISIPLTLGAILIIMLNGAGDYGGVIISVLIVFTILSVYRFTSSDNRYVDDFKQKVIKENYQLPAARPYLCTLRNDNRAGVPAERAFPVAV